MISSTQLRILRTLSQTSPLNTSARLFISLNAPTRRIHHQHSPLHAQQQPPPCAASRLFSTTNPSRQKILNNTTTTTTTTQQLSPQTANPPPTTRPPPLTLPTRAPETSTVSHLFATGKAYLAFYKTGLRHIYINTRLVWSLSAARGIPPDHTPPGHPAEPPTLRVKTAGGTTRSTELLRRRWRHDVRRLPVFALLLLVCGEFTPFVVLAVPGVVPLTCRIPRQVEKLRRKAEDRRAASFGRLAEKYGSGVYEGDATRTGATETQTQTKTTTTTTTTTAASTQHSYQDLSPADVTTHLARSLNLIATLWDAPPLSLLPTTLIATATASRKVRQHLAYLDRDNHLLHQAGGVGALEEDEVLLACEDRGIWPVEKPDGKGKGGGGGGLLLTSARENLRRWLYLVGDDEGLVAGRNDPWSPERAADREARMVVLMMRREWPRERAAVRAAAKMLRAEKGGE